MDLSQLLDRVNHFVWGGFMLYALVFTGVLLTLRCRFLQVFHLPRALRLVLCRPQDGEAPGDISPFQALTTALSATIGTGNIAGVATAIAMGGPGAVFWMWVCAFFGMATKFAEAVLAVRFRRTLPDGTMQGGPMRYIADGLGLPWLGWIFALMGAVAAFGIGSMVQSNSVAVVLREEWGVPVAVTGGVLAVMTGVVIIGGIRRIGRVTERLVPVMAVFYVAGSLLVLLLHLDRLPGALALIFQGAFHGTAAAGGAAGATVAAAVRYGVARGVFSNEAGLGSAPIAHAAARTESPVRQGLVAMTGVFFDTMVICTMTALVILTTGAWTTGETTSTLTRLAFEQGLPRGGGVIVSLGLAVFAYSTMIGWSYYGEECIEYLLGLRARMPYRFVFCAAIALGAFQRVDVVWNLADTMNGAMAIPNLVGLLGLSGLVARLTRETMAHPERLFS
ncbi:sodium:alanine symporter family protein [Dissulfurirhabdus thermomarina]|uniref:Sodium:alanine symporter family protein n=1 Tax=Dissulfurirhabdus thermomarina TaxID=1765737 RepID=A0A6N9TK82_DISTH|nr:sodium:alanine symporter family protein [Dissulfurirhabdus thermomarina]NDY41488.1 sodium:alanine symporter family protein [Dissulfurirhabdus thermomarina]NMX23885.1 sodium:alanine symporter family protein [Dissulfurirhabdus thermomarina]